MDEDEIRVQEERILGDIREHIKKFPSQRSALIPILQMIQERHAYIPAQSMEMVAGHLNISTSEVYGVATFYNQFRFNPPGKYPIKVCLGTACHVKAGDIILENFERKLEILEGETTKDRLFSLERVACVGCCALAPVAVVGDTVHGHMAPSKVEGLILRSRIEEEKEQRQQQSEGQAQDGKS